MTKTPDAIRAAVRDVMPSVRADLEALVRIPSVSADPARKDDVRRSAEATAELFRAEGFEDVQILSAGGGAPAVVARRPAPEGAPTVLLYAHHDVQPVGDPADWDSEPFEPTERGDRLYGRGAADDKAGIAAHLAAIRAHGDELPVGITLLVEGEEEVGSPTLEAFLDQHQDLLAADVIVIADSGNWDIGEPALTTSLRGLVDCFVEVRTLDHGVHSGMWGGVVPDAVTAMVRLLATLHDDEGNVAVEGLHAGPAADVEYPLERIRAESGISEGVQLIGSGSVVERLWTKPAIATIGFDATRTADASNTLIPSVKVKLSVRLAPGDSSKRAMAAPQGPPREARPLGRAADLHPRRARRAHPDRRDRPGVRRGAGRLPRRVGRRGAGRHGRRRLDPVHRRVQRGLPRRGRPGHRRRGPGHPRARRQRGAAPRRVREGLPGRGAAAAQPGPEGLSPASTPAGPAVPAPVGRGLIRRPGGPARRLGRVPAQETPRGRTSRPGGDGKLTHALDPHDLGPQDACGVFGVWAPGEDVAKLTYYGLYALQHRGQESAGIAVSNGRQILVYKDMGLVSQVFDESTLESLKGHLAVGHARYSTTGASTWHNAQPTFRPTETGSIALAHNGNLTNTRELAEQVAGLAGAFGELDVPVKNAPAATNDTSLVTALLAHHPDMSLEENAVRVLPGLRGAFSFVWMDENTLYAARDPQGVRPLVLGRLERGWVVASETAALDIVGASFIREVEPGEMVAIDEDGLRSRRFADAAPKHCLFEFVYLARPDTLMNDRRVHSVRVEIGRRLAREFPTDADLVMPVPESGTPAAIGYAEESGIPYGTGLVKNSYVGRTFIQPSQTIRQLGIRLKLNPLRDVIEGKRLVVVDDSIVRGNTQRALVRMLREAGAREVHVRISSPPVKWPCFYGIDFATRAELIANGLTSDEICRSIDADSLGYISLDQLVEATEVPMPNLCRACFDGVYPIPLPDPEHLGKHLLELDPRVVTDPQGTAGLSLTPGGGASDSLDRP